MRSPLVLSDRILRGISFWPVVLVFMAMAGTIARAQTYTLSNTSIVEGPGSGFDFVGLTVTPSTATWVVTANASWLHVATSGGTGSGLVGLVFDANSGATRIGTFTIGGQILTVTQAGSTYISTAPLEVAGSVTGDASLAGIAIDGGNLYLADESHSAIYELTSNTLSTLPIPGLTNPSGVASDGAGNLYIADTGNNAIKKWTAATQTITTLVSSGLNSPEGIALDNQGNVYFSDTGNNAIKEWTAATQTVTTLVSSGLNNPRGLAVDVFGNVYFADSFNVAIKEWTVATQTVSTLVSSGLHVPVGVSVDYSGNLWIADAGDNTVKEWSPLTQTVRTVFSDGQNEVNAIAFANSSSVYFTDLNLSTQTGSVYLLPLAFVDPTAKVEGPASGSDSLPAVLTDYASLLSSSPPTSDSSWLTIGAVNQGVVNFSFTANGTIFSRTAHINVLGQSVTVTQPGAGFSLPTSSLVEGPSAGTDSTVLASASATGTWTATSNSSWLHVAAGSASGTGGGNVIFSFDANTGPTRSGTITISNQTLSVTQAGSTYVPAGTLTTLVASGLSELTAIALDSSGNVYIAEDGGGSSGGGAILKWTASNQALSTVLSHGFFEGGFGGGYYDPIYPDGVAVDGAGDIYFSDNYYGRLTELSAGGTLSVPASATSPEQLAIDATGNIYLAQPGSNSIGKYNPSTQSISTLISGLQNPLSVALDGAGNVYIADDNSNAIQEWVQATQTLVPLVTSGVSYSSSVAVDGSGNVYLTDPGNKAIKKWTAATQSVAALVSSGISYPTAVAADSAGDIYFADAGLNTVSVLPRAFVDPTSKSEGPVAGSDSLPVVLPSSENLSGPLAPSSDSSWLTIGSVSGGVVTFSFATNSTGTSRTGHITLLGQAIAVTQSGPVANWATSSLVAGPGSGNQSIVLQILPAGTAWTAVSNSSWLHLASGSNSGTGNATLSFSLDANIGATRTGTITVDGQTFAVTQAGSTYVAASGLTTIVPASLKLPEFLAMDATGNIFIADAQQNAIKKWVPATQTLTTLVSSGLNNPEGVAVDGAGNVYFSDNGNNAIKKWTATTQSVTTLVSSGLNHPTGVGVDGAGNVYFADSSNSAIKKWTATNQSVSTLVSSGLTNPQGIAVDAAGDVYFADVSNGTVKSWSASTHNVSTLVSSGLNQPFGVALDSAGNVYIADTSNNALKKWTAATGSVTTLVSSGLTSPFGVVVDGAGNVYIGEWFNNSIKEWVASINTVIPTISNLAQPKGLAVDTLGNVYIADTNNSAIKEWTPSGQTLTTLVSSGLNIPLAVAVDSSGNVYIADTNNSAIKKWTATTQTVTTLVSWTPDESIAGLAVDGSGNVYFSDSSSATLQKWTKATQSTATIVSSGFVNPTGVAVDGDGNVYISDGSNGTTVDKWLSSTQSLSSVFFSSLIAPWGVAVDGSGNVYVTDSNNNAIDKWTATTQTVSPIVSGLNNPLAVAVDLSGNVYIADSGNDVIDELPHAFLDPTSKAESAFAGSDTLPAVIPASQDLQGVFAPASDSSWLTIGTSGGGVVSFSFTANTANVSRTGHITLLGQSITVTQAGAAAPTGLIYATNPATYTKGTAITANNPGNSGGPAGSYSVSPALPAGLNLNPVTGVVTGTPTVVTASAAYTVTATNGSGSTTASLTITVNDVAPSSLTYATTINVDSVGAPIVNNTPSSGGGVVTRYSISPNLPAGLSLNTSTGVISGTPTALAAPSVYTVTASNSGGSTTYTLELVVLPPDVLGQSLLVEGPAAASGQVQLRVTPANGAWSATSNASWLHVSPGSASGTGSAAIQFTTDANSGATRTGTMAIGGQAFMVTQAGATYVQAGVLTTLFTSGLSQPYSVAVDASGNVYVVDGANNTLQEWSPMTQSVSTLVSTGLNEPIGVAVDLFGNVFIADNANNAIKEWMPAAQSVSTLVSTGLNKPRGVAVDLFSNVFIADEANNAIKEWMPATQSVNTLVSTGLNGPRGAVPDVLGNVYIADYGNSVIKEWMPGTQLVSTLISSGLSQPTGLTVDGFGNVYIPGAGMNAVREWTAATQSVVTLVSEGLSNPKDAAVDAEGNIYVADFGDIAVKELPRAFVDPTPKSEPVGAESDALPAVLPTTENLQGVFAPTSDQTWLTINSVAGGVVSYSFTANPGTVPRTAHITVLGQQVSVTQEPPAPSGLTYAANPAVYTQGIEISANSPSSTGGTAESYSVSPNLPAGLSFNAGTGVISGTPTVLAAPIVYTVTATNSGGSTTCLLDLEVLPADMLAQAATVWGPSSGSGQVQLAVTPAGAAWSASSNASWLHLSPGSTSGTNGATLQYTFDVNTGGTRIGIITVGGQTYSVTQAGSSYVAAGILTTLISSGLNMPFGLAIDSSGNIYIADSGDNVVDEWIAATGTLNTLISTGLNEPRGVALDAYGNVYIADTGDSTIREWSPNTKAISTLIFTGINAPYGVATNASGNVYIADMGNNAVEEWSPGSQTLTTLVSSGLSGPRNVVLDIYGNVYIADFGNNAVKEWMPASQTVSALISTGLNEPRALALDGAGNIYIDDYGDNSIMEWNASTQTLTTLVSTGLNGPRGVALDALGNIYIADTNNNAVEELPRAFMDPTPKLESVAAGTDSLPPVLPLGENLQGAFAPTSDSSWLTITGITGGIVSYSFTANPGNTPRVGHITVLGQQIMVTQAAPPTVTGSTANLAENAATFVITGTGFDPIAGNNSVTFSDGAIGVVTAATATSLTVSLTTDPTSLGNLTVVVTTDGQSSGTAMQVATVGPAVYAITTSATPTADGSASGGGTFNSGASVTVTATPNAGYTFVDWTANGSPVSVSASYTFSASANQTLVANFSAGVPAMPDWGWAVLGGTLLFVVGRSLPIKRSPY